jgi:hypothetical protein
MLLFRSEEWVDKWRKRNNLERGEILTIDQVWVLSKLWYSNRMSLDFHGRSMEQAAEIFKDVGLRSKFWYI